MHKIDYKNEDEVKKIFQYRFTKILDETLTKTKTEKIEKTNNKTNKKKEVTILE